MNQSRAGPLEAPNPVGVFYGVFWGLLFAVLVIWASANERRKRYVREHPEDTREAP